MSNVAAELKQVLVTRAWQAVGWMSALDVLAARDADLTDEILPEHIACVGIERAEWERLVFLRDAVTPADRPQLVDAIEHTQRAGLVELLALTCETSKEFTAALRKAAAGAKLQPAIDYASRRFVREPAVAKKLWARAKAFAKTARAGKWNMAGEQAWRALYVSDTRESADAMTEMIAATWSYTNLAAKQRLCAAAAKRARLVKHGKRCSAPLVEAMQESYTHEEITHSAIALRGVAVKKHLEEKWREYSEYQTDNDPARVAIGGLLAVGPAKAYQDAAAKMLPKMLKEGLIATAEIGRINGIVMGVQHGRVRALHPLLDTIARWKYKPRFDAETNAHALLAAELLRRRARKALDGR